MRRTNLGTTALVAVALCVGTTSSAVAKATTIHFKGTIVGAQVSSNENIYDLRGLGLRGAAIQIFKSNAKGTGGTDTIVSYYGIGTQTARDTYTNSPPDANGIVTIKGSGHFVRGTGTYAHIRGKYTFTGTFNAKTGRLRFKLVGRETF